jgi:hypothetical protein
VLARAFAIIISYNQQTTKADEIATSFLLAMTIWNCIKTRKPVQMNRLSKKKAANRACEHGAPIKKEPQSIKIGVPIKKAATRTQ